MNKLTCKGQTLLELVVGLGILLVVLGAAAISTTQGLRNSQFSKNQAQATKLAQENMEIVRTIKNSNLGVCLSGQGTTSCLTWEGIWTNNFGNLPACANPTATCTFEIRNNTCTLAAGGTKPICLVYKNTPAVLSGGIFSYQVYIENEDLALPLIQKRVTSRVFWTDSTGQHSSDLVTVFSRY